MRQSRPVPAANGSPATVLARALAAGAALCAGVALALACGSGGGESLGGGGSASHPGGASSPSGSGNASSGPTNDGASNASSGAAASGSYGTTRSSQAGSSASSSSSQPTGSSSSSTSAGDAGGGSGAGEGPLASGVRAFPAPGATGVCPDPPLRLTFSAPPTLGASGKIQVFDASQPSTPVAVVDMGAATITDTLGGVSFALERPAYVDGNDAVVYLKSHALTYGKTYYVTVDSGAIAGPSGPLAVTGSTAWRFTTAAAAPASASSLVALDGSGAFCTVQRAIDAIPANNAAAVTVTLAPGRYHEVVHFASKNNVTMRGQSRTGSIIEGTNNNNLNPSTTTRSLVGVDGSSGVVFDTLTIQNLTPQGGSQAEALRLESCDKCVVRNATITSLQDTVLWSGRVYATGCTISGNVDFVWGTGAAYFNQCELHTTGRAGAVVQARNGASGSGYVFVDSTLTADPGVSGQVLGRIDDSVYPASQVAYVNCTMGSFIAPAGWTITGGASTAGLRFWEYQSVDPTGKAIDVSRRIAGSTQISPSQAAMMRDPTMVLGGWQPPP